MDLYGPQEYTNKDGMLCLRHYKLMARFYPHNDKCMLMDRMEAKFAISLFEQRSDEVGIKDDVWLELDN